ncbi:MAG: gamma carbonic anhydrase family protein [Aquificota bacterium]|nr:MAG: gamma carbonic anhydrase family protein [Aquificota bacterium]
MIGWYKGKYPKISPSAFVAPNATVIGDVVIGKNSSVWFGSVVRGDVNYIRIGSFTNVQDNSVLHVTTEKFPLIIGDEVTMGHRVLVHGCVVGSRCLIGMGAILMDGVEIGDECLVAAGALIPPGTKVPHRSLVRGFPAKVVRELSDEEVEEIKRLAKHYANLASWYWSEYKGK